jgi:hypothetical protein
VAVPGLLLLPLQLCTPRDSLRLGSSAFERSEGAPGFLIPMFASPRVVLRQYRMLGRVCILLIEECNTESHKNNMVDLIAETWYFMEQSGKVIRSHPLLANVSQQLEQHCLLGQVECRGNRARPSLHADCEPAAAPGRDLSHQCHPQDPSSPLQEKA